MTKITKKKDGINKLNIPSYTDLFLTTSPHRNETMKNSKNEENHVRKLFRTDGNDEEQIVKFDETILGLNTVVKNGLCFICTYNIGLINFGVKCSKCSRNYHYKCLVKHEIYNDTFVCKSCDSKNNGS